MVRLRRRGPCAVRALTAALCLWLAAAGGLASAQATPVRPDRWVFDPGPGRDTEVSVAVDRRSPDRVLVAWQEDIRRVWTARTVNGGASWRLERLRDPAAVSESGGQDGFDPTAAFGPDGTPYVLMGVTNVPGAITLARLEGSGWTYHPVDPLGVAQLWDAMHLAVAPDTGHLYVTAQSILHRTIGFWRSSDGGTSWTQLRAPQLESPAGAGRVVQDGFEYWPRLAAGPQGRVLLLTKALLNDGQHIRANVSYDAGTTFGPTTVLTDGEVAGRLVGIPGAFDGSAAVAAYATDSDIAVVRADGAGPPWRATRFPRDTEWQPDWSTVAAGGGTTWLLHTEQRPDTSWRALLTRIRGRRLTTVTLGTAQLPPPRGTSAGDEYGGLAIGARGCVWAAWAEPRRDRRSVIALRRRC